VTRVGLAGLGAMGAGIAHRLHDAGCDVVCWNRTKEKAQPLIEAGIGWAETPRELAASVDLLFTMLTNTAAIASRPPATGTGSTTPPTRTCC
jgi:3-hydroxyisobutyrate dehydrogenase-like beta-hydroxyacid dehydrogenase